MRKLQQFGSGGASLLDSEDPASQHRAEPAASQRMPSAPPRPRRELVDDFADSDEADELLHTGGRNRRIRRGLIPQTKTGRIAAALVVLALVAAACAGAVLGAQYLTTSPKFRIPSSQAIELDGNSHVTRAQMLSIFGGDVDRNIFRVPLDQRRAQLEQMPWVEHATVMRLLPSHIRVHVTERVPVAYVRQGRDIGMVDASGVLLDVPTDAPGRYSFPVITGIKPEDDAASRAERMKLYAAFLKDMDSDGKGASAQLSEVDLSDPEDVKALLPDHNTEVLVHFGTENFLRRYREFQDHIGEWRAQYPRLSSVDMRYERQVVLQMPPKDAAAATPTPDISATSARPAAPASAKAPSVPAKASSAPSKASSVLDARKSAGQPAGSSPVARSTAATAAKSTASHQPAAKPAAVAHPVSHKAGSEAKDAAMRKRVDAIKAWMAKREKARAAAAGTQ